MKILSLILSTTMLVSSIPCSPANAKHHLHIEGSEFTQPQTSKSAAALRTDDFKGVRTDDFKRVIQRGTFVDKTPFIEEIIKNPDEAILITRPRRWGKSLNMSMLKYFLNREVNKQGQRITPNPNRILFTGGKYDFTEELEKDGQLVTEERSVKLPSFKISEDLEFMTRHQGQYPTVLLSLKEVEATTYQGVEGHLRTKISEIFKEHPYIYDSLVERQNNSALRPSEREEALSNFNKFKRFYSHEAKEATLEDLQDSLRFLSELLRAYHGRNAYILIDEYDTPLHQVASQDALNNVTLLLRGLFSSACKGNLFVEKCLFTGILRIAQANLLSGLNNPSVYTLLDSKYASYYGFTQEEVDKLFEGRHLDEFQYPADRSIVPVSPTKRELSEHTHKLRTEAGQEHHKQGEGLKQELARVYNGYLIGGTHLYNPWSIVNVLSDKVLRPYWVDSGGISYIKDALFSDKANEIWSIVRDRKSFPTKIAKDISMSSVRLPDSLPSLLFHAGYLTLDQNQAKNDGKVNIVIPNEEVYREFERLLESYASMKGLKEFNEVEKTFKMILQQDIEALNVTLSSLKNSLSGTPYSFTSGWNFNFLQIAALTGNKDIFECVLKYDNSLLNNVHGIDKLNVADYALLARKEYYQLADSSPPLQKPWLFTRLICSDKGIYAAGAIAAGAGYGYDQLQSWLHPEVPLPSVPLSINPPAGEHPLLRFIKKTGVSFVIGSGVTWLVKSYVLNGLTSYCQEYNEYEKIDSSKPATISSLKQLEKYLIENSNTYISLDGNCREETEPMTTLKIPTVNIQTFPSSTLLLTLCVPKQQGDL